jgi:tripartite-type tricarboxylate transporter receptor subunit TctC
VNRIIALLALVAALIEPAFGQAYPARPIRLVVPFAPGGSADATARPIAEKLGAALGQPVVIDNRGGGLTVIGADLVAKSPPDGYTLFLMPGTHVLSPLLVRNVPFDPIKDFTPVSMVASVPHVLFADPKLPFATVPELVTYAKANPGKLSVGTTDAIGRLAFEALRAATKIDIAQVNYKAAGTLAGDVVGSHIQLGFLTPPATLGFYKDRRINALAVTGPTRIPSMPNVPPMAEAAGIPGYNIQTWFALAGPAGLPRPIVERLQREMSKILADPDTRDKLGVIGMDPISDASTEKAIAVMREDQERLGKLIQQVGIRPE